MGGVMRRASSVVAIGNTSRPSTPSAVPGDDTSRRSSTGSGSIARNADAKKSTTSLNGQTAASPAPAPASAESVPAVEQAPAAPAVDDAAPAPTVVEPTSASVEPSPTPEAAPNGTTNGDATDSASPSPKPSPAIKRLLPIASQYQSYPSPISESPVREDAANAQEAADKAQRDAVVGPSPLANVVAVEDAAPAAQAQGGYVPPAVVLDSSNPGAFTDEPEEMHMHMHADENEPVVASAQPMAEQLGVVPDPVVERVVVAATPVPVVVEDAPAPVGMPQPEAAPAAPAPSMPEPEPATLIAVPIPAPAIDADTEPAPVFSNISYFDIVPRPAPPAEDISPNSTITVVPGTRTALEAEEQWRSATATKVEAEPFPYDAKPVPIGEVTVDTLPVPESAATATASQPIPIPIPNAPAAAPVAVPVEELQDMDMDEVVPVPDVWREDEGVGVGRTMPVPVPVANPELYSNPEEDPFADPPMRPRTVDDGVFLVPIPVVDVEEPMDSGYGAGFADQQAQAQAPVQEPRFSTLPVPMPVGIPFPQGPFGSIHSMYSGDKSPNREFFERMLQQEASTDEHRPLLGRPLTPPSNGHHHHHHHHRKYHSTAVNDDPSTQGQNLHDLGWLVYALPDGLGVYYVHPTLRVTTDADLRVPVVLARVGRALGYSADAEQVVFAGRTELWLREVAVPQRKGQGTGKGGKGKGRAGRGESIAELGLTRWSIDHAKREVAARDGVSGVEDHLDMEYRYWAYMESHPAHSVVPYTVRREAMNLLTWSWTDRLLPPQEQALPPPFTQEECQELLALLRSFGDAPQPENGIQSVVLTRVVSRIMLRLALWRQHHFRPHKALPVDSFVGSGVTKSAFRTPGFARKAVDVLLSCVLLGVPFLFYDRHAGAGVGGDAERGVARLRKNLLPILVVGACTCLLAAILLSTSITFLSLPGLDRLPPTRTIVLVVAVLAGASVVAGLGALFRLKRDVDVVDLGVLGVAGKDQGARFAGALRFDPAAVRFGSGAAQAGAGARGEGMLLVSSRSLILSLPLVFLVYAVVGFVAAVVLYTYSSSGAGTGAGAFPMYTRWAVLGAAGGLAGVLFMAGLLVVVRR
ncbi:hypothetical protein HMN09_00137200 [Mycena chlorophos]|uniref:Uncharacterized protein n=1 Tax=Mycena chlorophos TaxID=658473 RepID=A0A8H6TMY1_MYCCL|nr:hypothetical protein HMN09_00137200 [Mycena chlorophos]